jgi:hypothetical protein
MRIEVLVPGIRKERGKLPAPRTLGALWLAAAPAAGPPICGEFDGPAMGAPVIGAKVGVAPLATAHPVSAKPTRNMPKHLTSELPSGCRLHPMSDCGALLRPRGVEPAIALFDAPSPLVPGNDDPDMIWPSALACRGDFQPRLAGRQSKDLFAQT